MATLIVGDDGSNTLPGTAGADLIYGYDPTNGPQNQASAITATRVATGLTLPTFAGAPPGDTSRLFIVEKTGQIKILDLASGQVLATPFLDLSGQISDSGERGLLGLAFDPNFATNGFIYIDVSVPPVGNTEIRRYHVDPLNPNVVEAGSGTLLLTIPQFEQSNHKGGWLGFGPDGYLYITVGDGGGGFDQLHSGQDINSLRGKILRIDVHNGDDFPADPGRNYHIPADNPFVGTDGADEIFAYGLRNPWRASFDRGLGDFYIGDVGQNRFEEVNLGEKGVNYGWNAYEGPGPTMAFPPGQFPDPVNNAGPLRFPIDYYGREVGQSITGGYVYRGEAEALQGQYFFADFVQGKVFTLRFDSGTNTWVRTDRTSQITTDFGAINGPSSFGEDGRGNLYLVDLDFFNPSGGEVFKLTPVVASADQADVLSGLGGNDMLFGGSGNDTLAGGVGADVLLGGPGMDTADYSASSAAVNVNLQTGLGAGGDAQGDILGGVENVIGSAFNDMLTGDSGANTLDGGLGNDTLAGAGGADLLIGGPGIDTADYSSSGAAVLVNLQAGADAQGAMLSGIENVIGSAFADTLTGDSNANTLTGGAGNDTLAGGGGADALIGGPGTDTADYSSSSAAVNVNLQSGVGSGGDAQGDTLSGIENVVGSAFNDVLTGDGNANTLTGGAGNDTLAGGIGADALNGGAGSDTADYSTSGAAVSVNLQTGSSSGGDAQGDTLNSIENVIGSAFADMLTGDSNANTLTGEAGNDTLVGGPGTDLLIGGPGTDTADYSSSGVAVLVNLQAGADAEGDMLSGIENVVGSAFSDTLTGDSNANTLAGGAGNDTLIGGLGNDTLDGGRGMDTAVFSGLRSAYTINHIGNTLVVTGPDGSDTLTHIEKLTFNDGTVLSGLGPVHSDFSGDSTSDLLWRHDSGQLYFWNMNGLQTNTEGGPAHAAVPNDWHVQGTGDFDADGNSDVLWRHDSGQVYFWEMDGLQVKAEGAPAHAPVPTSWHIQGTGDFNADGNGDILWRHDTGPVYLWEMDGLQVKAEGAIAHAAVPNDWHIQGIGDFDGDTKSDILWRHDSGQVYIWEMDGLNVKTEGGVAHALVPNDWHVQGVGDFDGDGKSDILWRHDTGQVYIWEMNGLNVKTEGAVAHAFVPNDWHVQGVGDFNDDGNSDILWRHDSGQVYIWEMNGLQVKAEGAVAHAAVPNDWHIQL
jgi:Ca2+-binding RTX toxin-like protein